MSEIATLSSWASTSKSCSLQIDDPIVDALSVSTSWRGQGSISVVQPFVRNLSMELDLSDHLKSLRTVQVLNHRHVHSILCTYQCLLCFSWYPHRSILLSICAQFSTAVALVLPSASVFRQSLLERVGVWPFVNAIVIVRRKLRRVYGNHHWVIGTISSRGCRCSSKSSATNVNIAVTDVHRTQSRKSRRNSRETHRKQYTTVYLHGCVFLAHNTRKQSSLR